MSDCKSIKGSGRAPRGGGDPTATSSVAPDGANRRADEILRLGGRPKCDRDHKMSGAGDWHQQS
jgi:hypothetical protein